MQVLRSLFPKEKRQVSDLLHLGKRERLTNDHEQLLPGERRGGRRWQSGCSQLPQA